MESGGGGTLLESVEREQWYHTLELAPGVVTPGWFDTRSIVDKVPLPKSLDGMRCLDVGTFDGFWAFEMERRGAREVVAIDVPDPRQWDWPPLSPPEAVAALAARQRAGAGFQLARDALGSQVERRAVSVYDLDPSEIGSFDFVYLGSLLIHLRDPVAALTRVRGVCGGELLLVDNYEPFLSLLAPRTPLARLDGRDRPWWWQANTAGVVRMVEAAGFEVVERPRRLRMPPGRGQQSPPLRPRTLLDADRRRNLRNARRGDPHLALLARPRAGP
jgi:tRNA (mo5U34)-methyltransferase